MSGRPDRASTTPAAVGPPSTHQLALMIWLAVFPTLTVLNIALSDRLATAPPVLRTFVLASIAVPIVVYGLMPQLHKARVRLLGRRPELATTTREGSSP